MTSPLSNLVEHFAEGIHKTKCQQGHNNKRCETCGIKYRDVFVLNTQTLKII